MCVPLSLSIPCSLNGRLPRRNCSVYQADRQTKFAEASRITGEEFLSFLHYYAKAWLPARDVVKAAMEKRFDVDASGQIVVFHQVRPSPHLPLFTCQPRPSTLPPVRCTACLPILLKLKPFESCPWKDHLFTLEPGLPSPSGKPILYVLYPESEAPGAKWRIQCVPQSTDSFENRKSLPEAWRGVRDAELSKVSGIPGGVFVHAAGFTGGNETYEGVLEMARKAIPA